MLTRNAIPAVRSRQKVGTASIISIFCFSASEVGLNPGGHTPPREGTILLVVISVQ